MYGQRKKLNIACEARMRVIRLISCLKVRHFITDCDKGIELKLKRQNLLYNCPLQNHVFIHS